MTYKEKIQLPIEKSHIVALLTLFLIPALIYYVEFLAPQAIKEMLVLHTPPKSLLPLWGSSFLHPKTEWAVSNIESYLRIAIPLLLVLLTMKKHKKFTYFTLLGVFVIPPIVFGPSTLAGFAIFLEEIPTGEASTGASGLISLTYGGLVFALYYFMKEKFSRKVGLAGLLGLFTIAIHSILRVHGFVGGRILRPVFIYGIIGLVVVGAIIRLVPFQKIINSSRDIETISKQIWWGVLIIVGSYSVKYFGLGIFPASLESYTLQVGMNSVHMGGFVSGFILLWLLLSNISILKPIRKRVGI